MPSKKTAPWEACRTIKKNYFLALFSHAEKRSSLPLTVLQTPPRVMPARTHYSVLNLPVSASASAVRAAFLELSLSLHPDKPGGCALKFATLQQAYETLRDPKKRAIYDAAISRVVNDEVELDEMCEEKHGWEMECRCGGWFELGRDEVGAGGSVWVLECDMCSLALRVVAGRRIEN